MRSGQQGTRMKNKTLNWILAVSGKKTAYIAFLAVLTALLGGSSVLYALLLKNAIDSATAGNTQGFVVNAVLIALLVLAQIALRALIRWLNELSKSEFENRFKQRLFNCILRKDYASVSALHSGDWMTRLTNDTRVVANGCVEILPELAGTLVRLVSALVMLLILEPRFAFIMLPCGAAMILISYAFRRILKKLHKTIQEKNSRLRVFMQEHISSLAVVRSFAAEERAAQEAGAYMGEHKAARLRRTRYANVMNVCVGFAVNGMYLFGVLYCCAGILQGTVSFGMLTAVTHLVNQLMTPLAGISGYVPRYYSMIASAERLMEIEAFEDDFASEAKSAAEAAALYDSSFAAFGLSDVRYSYYPAITKVEELSKEHMPVVLDGVSIEVKKGEFVAFTGHSGCGKSTVLKLMMCVYKPDGGTRYILDTRGGKTELTPEWRRLFAYVPQGSHLLSGTLREAVAMADGDAADDAARLDRALRIACADEFVNELENGVDTLLGERGTGLSEGQMQRIAIARAVFSSSPILLLDEATSALDAPTERRLLENLKSMTNKTVLIVTHRPAALEFCDRILSFTENGIAEANAADIAAAYASRHVSAGPDDAANDEREPYGSSEADRGGTAADTDLMIPVIIGGGEL